MIFGLSRLRITVKILVNVLLTQNESYIYVDMMLTVWYVCHDFREFIILRGELSILDALWILCKGVYIAICIH